MPSLLDEIWIFSKDGIPIVDFARIGSVDKSMLGSFISAIKTFVREISKGQLKSINVGNDKYTFTSCVQNEVILVCKSPLDVKDKNDRQVLNLLRKKLDAIKPGSEEDDAGVELMRQTEQSMMGGEAEMEDEPASMEEPMEMDTEAPMMEQQEEAMPQQRGLMARG